MSRRKALFYGIVAIFLIMAVQIFSSVTCYEQNVSQFFYGVIFFLGVPLLVALIGLLSKNPLRAVGASILIIPWQVIAYYTDCVTPYIGGGASFSYIAVLLWGSVGALIGLLITGLITKVLGVTVEKH